VNVWPLVDYCRSQYKIVHCGHAENVLFRGENGSVFNWLVNPIKGFFMADLVIPLRISPWNPEKKTKKSAVLSTTFRLAEKPVTTRAAPPRLAMCNHPWTLPLVSKTDQKMNGDGFFRSEYAAGDTGSDPHLTPRSGS
jgi:hypothetical protein